MRKNCVNWKAVKFTSKFGKVFESYLPIVFDRHYKGELLVRILAMPPKTPLIFEDAVRLTGQKFNEALDNNKIKEAQFFIYNFLEWISDSGYHIELTGEEFDFLNQTQAPA
jgi:hypothetical protein